MDIKNDSWKPFFKPFIPILYLILVFGVAISVIIEVNYVKQLSKTAQNEIVLESDIFKNEMNSQESNLLYLADIVQRVREFIPDENLFQDTLEGTLSDFTETNGTYDQIRFLDLAGKEVVRINRVNGEVNVVPKADLQDKSGRYFFQESRNLQANEIYISKFDLNVEYDVVELPQKPVYRLITPVELNDGSRIGYVVLNILGEPILNRITGADQIIAGKIYLINDSGDWLIGPEGTTPWGFMYTDAQNTNISDTFPEIWNKYQGEDLFRGYVPSGLFTFRLINPFDGYMAVNQMEVQGISHEKWILISYVETSLLLAQASLVILLTTLVVFVVLNFAFRQVAKNRWNERKAYQAREESEKKLDIISAASQDAIILINSKGLIEYWSVSAENMFGYSASEAFQKEIHQMITMHPKDRDMAYQGMEQYARTGEGPILKNLREMDAKTKDGQLVPVEISINPIRIENEWWAAGIIRDISERKKAEKEIRELAQFPLENANAVMRVDRNSVLLFANPASDFLLQSTKMKIGKKVPDPLRTLVLNAITKNERAEKRLEIAGKTYLFTIFPVVEAGYTNIYGVDVTEEEKARKELQANELKYRTLLNTIPQFVFHKDIHGKYITINDSLAKLMQVDAADVEGKTDFDLYPQKLALKRQESDQNVIKLGGPVETDEPVDPDQPDKQIVHMVKAPVFDKDGNIDGILGVFWDITQRVTAERDLAKLNKNLEKLVSERTKEIEVINNQLTISEKRYRAIIENQVEFVFRWNLQGRITYANQSFSSRFEKKVNEIEGSFFRDVISSDGMEELYAMINTITKDKPLLTTEIRNTFPNGEIVWEQWNCRAIFNNENEIVEIQNVGRDITELKRVQEQLYIQSSALEAAANGIIITDKDGTIIWANKALSRLTGYSFGDLVGKTPRVFKSGKMGKEFYQNLWETITAGNVWSGEVVNRKKNGNSYTEDMIITPVSTEAGEVTNFIAIKQDISVRKEIEAEVEQAREQAELANRAKSTFLANMSHEIRTPLNAIMGLNYLLKRTGVSDVQDQYLDKMQTASRTLLDTINDVLDFSKIEAEKIEIENVSFDLNTVLLDITDTEALKAHQKGIELIVSVGENIPDRIEGDPIRLKQVLRNLTNNAVKFTDKGEVVIDIEKIKEEKTTLTLQFSVSDTGIGLSPEQIERLFMPFQQADISTTRKYGGSGLGLAISKRIVQLMNGEIWVKSEIGKGSTFSFTVPFKKVPPHKRVDLFLSKEVIGKKVLIVDSNSKSSQWLARILKPTQAEVTQVGDLDTLQELLSPQRNVRPFDVVLVNNNVKGFRRMSDLMGIKKRFPQENIKVIHLTDTVQIAQQLDENESSSIDAILIKPINASQLYDTWMSLFTTGRAKPKSRVQTVKTLRRRDNIDKLKILLVEDNEINQEVIRELLEQNGAEIMIAENGQIALEMLEQQAFGLVLMDVQMPVMDGFAATREIRKNARYASMPIIALTANAQIEEKDMAEKAGMNDYITKPIEPKLLFDVIAKWTNKPVSIQSAVVNTAEMASLSIRGMDTAKGLARLNHDRSAYILLLNKFVKNHQQDLEKIAAFIKHGDWENARSTSHAIRGAAANLGAEKLAVALMKIEGGIKDKNGKLVHTELETAKKAFAAIVEDLSIINEKPAQPQSSELQEPLDQTTLKTKLKLLLQKIRNHDPEAKILINEINQSIPATQFEGLLVSAQSSLEAYDFEKAGTEINKVIKMIKNGAEDG